MSSSRVTSRTPSRSADTPEPIKARAMRFHLPALADEISLDTGTQSRDALPPASGDRGAQKGTLMPTTGIQNSTKTQEMEAAS